MDWRHANINFSSHLSKTRKESFDAWLCYSNTHIGNFPCNRTKRRRKEFFPPPRLSAFAMKMRGGRQRDNSIVMLHWETCLEWRYFPKLAGRHAIYHSVYRRTVRNMQCLKCSLTEKAFSLSLSSEPIPLPCNSSHMNVGYCSPALLEADLYQVPWTPKQRKWTWNMFYLQHRAYYTFTE